MSTIRARVRTLAIAPVLLALACSGKGGGAQQGTVTVPNVVGMTETSAVASLATAGLVGGVGSSRVDLQACKLEYSIVSPK